MAFVRTDSAQRGWIFIKSHMSEQQYVITNLSVYLSIAKDSLAQTERVSAAKRRPKPDGSPGFIVTFDPEQTSFNHALVALVTFPPKASPGRMITGIVTMGRNYGKKTILTGADPAVPAHFLRGDPRRRTADGSRIGP